MSEDKPPPIDIRPDHWAIVRDILKRHVPDCDVWAFGSRAGWTAKPYSDLDLAVSCAAPLSLEKLGELRDAFSESDLPWKVDVVDLATVDAAFRKIIEAGKVEVRIGSEKMSPLRLGDHCVKIGSGATPRGGKEVYLNEGPFSLIRSQNIYNDKFEFQGLAYIDDEQARKLQNVEVEQGDVLINITGDSVARVCQVHPEALPARVNQHVAIIRTKPSKIDSTFLRYWLVTSHMQNQLLALASAGATRNALTKSMLEGLEVPAYDLNTQHDIASVLSALDDKIELNRRMNETLEQMALAIFRDWFVDFGPVRRKQEGARDPIAIMGGLVQDATRAAELAALFPDAFGDDSFPEGWSPIRLGDYIEVKRGGSPRPIQDFIARSGLPWLKISDATAAESPYLFQTKEFIREEGLKKTVQLKEGSLILSNSATPGLPKFVMLDACIHDGWLYFPNKKFFSDQYLYLYFLHLRDSLVSQGNGSIFTNLKTEIVRSQQMLIPSVEIIFSFQEIIAPVFEMILAASKENRTLIEARDYLLPKLMSGEVSVRETESIAEAAL